ncbi:alkaline phosphatase family protein [Azoarcus sp. L1K30]|uniref:alkaline phosphatase family protein n=1 Tax=Azoarcus sp. L1K30 TaxID=2820277 RepID=UPI001B8401C7|nr:alkaline phosphatase family protein [Azoarcus sp. L1K30]MBR0565696.1 alkaline phosphatase family protein [Azoarcus sp. L1K30]
MKHPPFLLPRNSVLPDFQGGGLFGLARDLRAWLHAPEAVPLPFVDAPPTGPLVLVVIDGLGDVFLQRHGAGSTLLQHRLRHLTSVFPSTTASAVTTLQTGLSPVQHGLTGWHIHDRRFGGVVTPLPLRRRGSGALRAPFLAQRLFPYAAMYGDCRLPVAVVAPADIAFSAFSRRHGRGAVLNAFSRPDGFVPAIVDALAQNGSAPQFLHAYYSRFDAVCHRFGAHSDQAIAEFHRVDRLFARLLDQLAGQEVTVLLTADHGFVDAPERKHLRLAYLPELSRMLASPLFGERRVAFCRVRKGAGDDFLALATARLRGRAVVQPSQRLIEAGMFGPGKPSLQLSSHCGTHALLMEPGWTISDRMVGEKDHRMRGVHGGLSGDEMWVPLIVARP